MNLKTSFRNLIILLLVACVTLAVLFAYYNPLKLEEIWIWAVGLLGTAIAYAKEVWKSITRFLDRYSEKFTDKTD